MINPVLKDLVATTGELAVLPTTVVQLLHLLQDDACSADEIARVLERDAAMTANVLKVSNSAFFGLRRQVASSRDALVMLGNRAVAALAFATGMAPVMRRDLVGYGISRERWWDHCLLSATGAALTAERLGLGVHRCRVFTAGLVHDIGMLALDNHLLAVRQSIPTGMPLFGVSEREQQLLGFDHAQAGALLAQQWRFPDDLVQVVAHHHRPLADAVMPEAVGAVAVGNLVAQMAVDDLAPAAVPEVMGYLAQHGQDEAFLARLKDDLALDFEASLARATGSVEAGV